MKEAADLKWHKLSEFNVYYQVYSQSTHESGRANKLSNLWLGPFEVINKLSEYEYTIDCM